MSNNNNFFGLSTLFRIVTSIKDSHDYIKVKSNEDNLFQNPQKKSFASTEQAEAAKRINDSFIDLVKEFRTLKRKSFGLKHFIKGRLDTDLIGCMNGYISGDPKNMENVGGRLQSATLEMAEMVASGNPEFQKKISQFVHDPTSGLAALQTYEICSKLGELEKIPHTYKVSPSYREPGASLV